VAREPNAEVCSLKQNKPRGGIVREETSNGKKWFQLSHPILLVNAVGFVAVNTEALIGPVSSLPETCNW